MWTAVALLRELVKHQAFALDALHKVPADAHRLLNSVTKQVAVHQKDVRLACNVFLKTDHLFCIEQRFASIGSTPDYCLDE